MSFCSHSGKPADPGTLNPGPRLVPAEEKVGDFHARLESLEMRLNEVEAENGILSELLRASETNLALEQAKILDLQKELGEAENRATMAEERYLVISGQAEMLRNELKMNQEKIGEFLKAESKPEPPVQGLGSPKVKREVVGQLPSEKEGKLPLKKAKLSAGGKVGARPTLKKKV